MVVFVWFHIASGLSILSEILRIVNVCVCVCAAKPMRAVPRFLCMRFVCNHIQCNTYTPHRTDKTQNTSVRSRHTPQCLSVVFPWPQYVAYFHFPLVCTQPHTDTYFCEHAKPTCAWFTFHFYTNTRAYNPPNTVWYCADTFEFVCTSFGTQRAHTHTHTPTLQHIPRHILHELSCGWSLAPDL